MVMRSMIKLTYRSIRTFLGRYLALLLIVTLGVGFFSGLKITKDAMANACENFLTEQNFYGIANRVLVTKHRHGLQPVS